MIEKLATDAIMLLATIDPIGTLAVFAAVTRDLTMDQRRTTALKAVGYSAVILLGSIVTGQIILAAMGIKLISLQIAGGIILFLFGLQMVFGKSFKDSSSHPEEGHDLAVFPLAVPSIASPGAIMAVILLTDNYHYSIPTQIGTSAVMLAVLGITYLLMLWASPILKVIGTNGAAILVRVMGMILSALSVEFIMKGLGVERWLVDGF
jgi:multiple antibiotic resistance protein